MEKREIERAAKREAKAKEQAKAQAKAEHEALMREAKENAKIAAAEVKAERDRALEQWETKRAKRAKRSAEGPMFQYQKRELTKESICHIKRAHGRGVSMGDLAEHYKKSRSTIFAIVHGKRYIDVVCPAR